MGFVETDLENLARSLLARLSFDYGDAEDVDPEVAALFLRGERLLPVSDVSHPHYGRFELRQDDFGRRYWWGAEDGWKDPTEIGENGVLMLDAAHFAIGTVITLVEPCEEDDHEL